MSACVRACVRACARACVCVCVCVCVCDPLGAGSYSNSQKERDRERQRERERVCCSRTSSSLLLEANKSLHAYEDAARVSAGDHRLKKTGEIHAALPRSGGPPCACSIGKL